MIIVSVGPAQLDGIMIVSESNLPHPNEDFGRTNQPFRMCFRSTFQGREYSKQLHCALARQRLWLRWSYSIDGVV